MPYTWKPEQSLGDAAIDTQRRQLLDLANLIAEARNGDAQEKVARDALLALRRHVTQHFDDEELLLAAVGSPLLEEHRQLHENLMTEFKQLWMASRLNLLNDVLASLSAWLAKRVIPHMMEDDLRARWEHLEAGDARKPAEASAAKRAAA